MLSLDRLRSLQSAAIQLGLSRETLLAGIDRQIIARLPDVSARSDQLLLDLVELSGAGSLADGSKPLVIWLRNVLHLALPRKEAEVFRTALAELGEPTAEPAAADPPEVAAELERESSMAAAEPRRGSTKSAAKPRRPSSAAKPPVLHIGAGAIVVGGNVSGSKLVTAAPASKNTKRTRSPGKKKT